MCVLCTHVWEKKTLGEVSIHTSFLLSLFQPPFIFSGSSDQTCCLMAVVDTVPRVVATTGDCCKRERNLRPLSLSLLNTKLPVVWKRHSLLSRALLLMLDVLLSQKGFLWFVEDITSWIYELLSSIACLENVTSSLAQLLLSSKPPFSSFVKLNMCFKNNWLFKRQFLVQHSNMVFLKWRENTWKKCL